MLIHYLHVQKHTVHLHDCGFALTIPYCHPRRSKFVSGVKRDRGGWYWLKRWAINCVADSGGWCLCMSGHDGKANETVLRGCHKLCFIAGLCCLCRLSSKRDGFSSPSILNPVSIEFLLWIYSQGLWEITLQSAAAGLRVIVNEGAFNPSDSG